MENMTDTRESQSGAEQVKDRVQDVTDSVKSQTREGLRSQIDTRTVQAGDQVTSTAHAFRSAGDELRRQGNDRAASAVDAVAERGERLGSYLSGADADRVLREAEDFARRQPWLVAGAGLTLGFVAARFVKATSAERYRTSIPPAPVGYMPARQTAVPTAGGSVGIG
jgi:ElaB/YqjD/DUF883 family membrane-anchored ribosome-binding protein